MADTQIVGSIAGRLQRCVPSGHRNPVLVKEGKKQYALPLWAGVWLTWEAIAVLSGESHG